MLLLAIAMARVYLMSRRPLAAIRDAATPRRRHYFTAFEMPPR